MRQNRRRVRLVIIACLLALIGLGAVVAWFSFAHLTLRVATGPVGSDGQKFLAAFAHSIADELTALLHPGAFAGAVPDHGTLQHWIYYSFVTLTTVGYGDVTPVHPAARSLAMLEALIGQLYPAILLARLVSLAVGSRSAG